MISRLIRIFGAIDNLMYSSKDIVKVIEELGQFDCLKKVIQGAQRILFTVGGER